MTSLSALVSSRGRRLEASEYRTRYAGEAWLEWFVDDEEAWLIEGGLELDGLDSRTVTPNAKIIIDGDLEVVGDLELFPGDHGDSWGLADCVLVVRGDVSARTLRYGNSVTLAVTGEVRCEVLCLGLRGNWLEVGKRLKAPLVVLDSNSWVKAAEIDGVVCAEESFGSKLHVGLGDPRLEDFLALEVLYEPVPGMSLEIDYRKLWERSASGAAIRPSREKR